ncbi:MAG TPA: prolipoprotein diacylglyceryl transferase family protein [Terriglobales bacterium]|nr:prolipoprotein diacylglyceryl transferase family protein [Terriglobales bacterium]
MRPILFHLGELPVPAFWTMALLGFLLALLVVRAEVKRRGYGADVAYDIVLYAYIGGWVGARLFLIPTGWHLFRNDPLGFLLSGSGWVWYGGVIGGAVGVLWLARQRGMGLLTVSDITAPALAMGLAIGRIGCQLSGDGDYGVATTMPWGMSYPDGVVPTTETVHPTPVYEMLGCFAIFAYLWRRRWQPHVAGSQIAIYLIASGALRFLIEFVRRNPDWLFGLTTAQWFSVVSIAAGVLLLRRRDQAAVPLAASPIPPAQPPLPPPF